MDWHYARHGKQLGPVPESELEALARSGQIDDTTLVWRPGLANWQPYGTVRPQTGAPPVMAAPGVCSVCRRPFAPDDLVSILGQPVCAACKPSLVQGLREGVAVGVGANLWRRGRTLVMARDALLPARCVKCNAPAPGSGLKRSLSWHHWGIYLLILVALLVYVIVALIVRKQAKIVVGLCERHRQQRRVFLGVAWVVSLLGVAGIVYGFATNPPLAIFGFLIVLVGVCIGNFGARVVYATRIDDRHIWLGGTCGDFLKDLPEWPGK